MSLPESEWREWRDASITRSNFSITTGYNYFFRYSIRFNLFRNRQGSNNLVCKSCANSVFSRNWVGSNLLWFMKRYARTCNMGESKMSTITAIIMSSKVTITVGWNFFQLNCILWLHFRVCGSHNNILMQLSCDPTVWLNSLPSNNISDTRSVKAADTHFYYYFTQ